MADVRDMYMAHTLFRREFGLLPDQVRYVVEGDRQRGEIVGAHIDLLCRVLSAHHEAEDLILWPLLLERAGQHAQAIVPTMQAQHASLENALATIAALLTPWRASAREGPALATVCSELNSVAVEHMALEEEQILPLAEKYVTAAETSAVVTVGGGLGGGGRRRRSAGSARAREVGRPAHRAGS
jgi:hemerythrin-like domain-containing protein